jgi:hypothetical protein
MNLWGILAREVSRIVGRNLEIGAMVAQLCGGEGLQAINFGDGSS